MNARSAHAAARHLSVARAEEELDEAMELMHFAFRRVIEAPDRALAKRGMGRLHHRLLYVIGHNPGIDIGRTLELLGVTPQAVHQPIRDLLDAEMLQVERAEDDRRRKELTLTTKGVRFERQLARIEHEVFVEAFGEAGADAERGWRVVMNALGRGRRLRG